MPFERKIMAKEIKKRIGSNFGSGYSSSIDGTLKVAKSVDITDECPKRSIQNRNRVILDFAHSSRGVMVCLNDCQPDKDYGSSVVNTLNDISKLKRDEITFWFRASARAFGLTHEHLVRITERVAFSLRSK